MEESGIKPSEQTAASLYHSYLQGHCRSVTYARGDDPPDFVFTCDGERHAVEVTELHQYLDVQGLETSRAKYDEAVRAICERCEKELGTSLDRLIGVYVSMPVPDNNLKSLGDAINSYVKSGKKGKEELFGRDDCWIESSPDPHHAIEGYVIPAANSRVPGSQTISADIAAGVEHALDRILSEKGPLLSQLRDYPQRILIIYPADSRCTAKLIRRVIPRLLPKHAEALKIVTKLFFVHRFRDLLDSSDSKGLSLEEVRYRHLLAQEL